jgi:hypothetical protein
MDVGPYSSWFPVRCLLALRYRPRPQALRYSQPESAYQSCPFRYSHMSRPGPLLLDAHTFRQVVAYVENIAKDLGSQPSRRASFVVLRLWTVGAMEVADLTSLEGNSVLGDWPARQIYCNSWDPLSEEGKSMTNCKRGSPVESLCR